MALLTYSPKDITISLAGLHTISGYVDGTFIKISKDVAPFKTAVAMDGETARLFQEDGTYTVDITLAQSSSSNSVLSTLWNIDAATQLGKFPIFVRDGNGQTTFFSAMSWIEQAPDVTFGKDIESRTWKFRCCYAGLTVGGAGNSSLIESAILAGASFLPMLKSFGAF